MGAPKYRSKPRKLGVLTFLPTTTFMWRLAVCFCIVSLVGVHWYLLYVALQHPVASDVLRRIPSKFSPEDLPPSKSLPIYSVSPLTPPDYEAYTLRINSWKRQEQLQVSLEYYKTCPHVAQIQVVWCTAQGPVPEWLLHNYTGIVVEKHDINSLNERFQVLSRPPTKGIFSIDDDVLRPCLALDTAFVKWTRAPNRIVGFDARIHVVEDASDRWKYGYLSTTRSANAYSMTLTRFCILHVDYMVQYMTVMPSIIRDRVAAHLNCEDIAMSLWVSAMTNGQVPLLADRWAMQSTLDLFSSATISSGGSHKQIRDDCVNDFATLLNVKSMLQPQVWRRSSRWFDCGDALNINETAGSPITWLHNVTRLRALPTKSFLKELSVVKKDTKRIAYRRGLLKNSKPWKIRFGGKKNVVFERS